MTSRTLVLLRHAKAETAAGQPDAERSLSARGQADATAAGAWLTAQGHHPDLVICSPARRTRQTWHAVAAALGTAAADRPAPTVRYENPVYDGDTGDLLDLIRDVPSEVGVVLLIGHNPTMSQLSALLDEASTPGSDGLPTSGVAVHQVTTDWSACGSAPAPVIASRP